MLIFRTYHLSIFRLSYKNVVKLYQQALTKTEDENFYTFLPTIYIKLAKAYQNLSDLITRLSDAVGDVFIEADDFLHRALLRISSALSSFTETRNQHLAGLKFRLENVVSNQIIMRQHFLEKLQAKMEEAHPRRILDKGYGIILIEGNKVSDISSIREGSKLTIVMQDGRVSLTAADVKVSKE